ncbi:MAG: excalibur calcium-binding domain-containing protein, partial [Candidatus Competibacteraceae bacterium]
APVVPTATAPVPAAPAPVTPPGTAPTANPSGWTCGTKTTCGQMSSCEEAKFHLTQCGVTRLDGDGDGIPCASLCRR